MSFKCPNCFRTFSQRSAYSQHVKLCIKKMEVEEDDVEMDNEGDQDSDYENNNIEVIVLFYVIKKKLLIN